MELEKIVKYYHENKISHAYLIETNNVDLCLKELKDVIKQIFCEHEYVINCNKCNICNLIEQNYLPSLVIIKSDGATIKKEQVLELKRNFSSLPVYTKENIYVIMEAEKLNGASANTMLKFVEEPEEHILGFFITNNVNNVIATIRSRCEILKVRYDSAKVSINTIKDDEMYLDVVNYLKKLEVEKYKGIMYNRDEILVKYKERDEVTKFFQIILIIYEEALKKITCNSDKFDFRELDFILKLSIQDILKRINLVTKLLDDIVYNVNIELLLDKFVIELGD